MYGSVSRFRFSCVIHLICKFVEVEYQLYIGYKSPVKQSILLLLFLKIHIYCRVSNKWVRSVKQEGWCFLWSFLRAWKVYFFLFIALKFVKSVQYFAWLIYIDVSNFIILIFNALVNKFWNQMNHTSINYLVPYLAV